jgi:hypothetical protein
MMNKKIKEKALLALGVVLALCTILFPNSCANTTTPPSGGDKDTIPPVIVGISPLPGETKVPVHGTKIKIDFDEYVTVKESKNIYLSPPQQKMPKNRIRGKTLEVYFDDDLEPNTTYTLDLTGAIQDNNESNLYPGYTLCFSTGDHVDSMAITGIVQDCNTLQPVSGATVMLYKDLADSAVYKTRPVAAVKTDDWGFFALRNVADTLYRLYAIQDEMGNNIYDPDNDKVAFIDSVIRPTIKINDTLPELLKYDMKDTLHCMARKAEYELNLFTGKPNKQLIENEGRTGDRTGFVTFMAPNAQIDSLWIRGIPQKNLILQFNQLRDSLCFWINDRRRMPDTLHVFVDYMKTDSTGTLKPFTEHLRLVQENVNKSRRAARKEIKKEDTTCIVSVKADPNLVEQYGFTFTFSLPIITENFDSLTLIATNPRMQESRMKFNVTRDTLDLLKYTLMPEGKLQKGWDYRLKVPDKAFRDINGNWSDSTEVNVSLPDDDKLSTLILKLTNVGSKCIVDLLNSDRTKTIRSYIVQSDQTVTFPYLTADKYSIRITEDRNGNGMVDTGDLLSHRQPEKVKFYKLRDGTYIININESTEMEQTVDVGKLFSSK